VTPTRDTTIAARVPLDLRADAERVVDLGLMPDLTHVIRIAVRGYVDLALAGRLCTANYCAREAQARGLCHRHYQAARRRGGLEEESDA
jgi:hypothetical protein